MSGGSRTVPVIRPLTCYYGGAGRFLGRVRRKRIAHEGHEGTRSGRKRIHRNADAAHGATQAFLTDPISSPYFVFLRALRGRNSFRLHPRRDDCGAALDAAGDLGGHDALLDVDRPDDFPQGRQPQRRRPPRPATQAMPAKKMVWAAPATGSPARPCRCRARAPAIRLPNGAMPTKAIEKKLITRPRLSSSVSVCRTVLAEAKVTIAAQPGHGDDQQRQPQVPGEGEADQRQAEHDHAGGDHPPQPHHGPAGGQVDGAGQRAQPRAAHQEAEQLAVVPPLPPP